MYGHTKEIKEVEFGLLSATEIKRISVCEITASKAPTLKSKQPLDSVVLASDGRLGTIEKDKTCETCKGDSHNCPGHFGHIELQTPIVNPLTHKLVLQFLRCFCSNENCAKLLLSEGAIKLYGLNKYEGVDRMGLIIDSIEKASRCCHCQELIYKYTFDAKKVRYEKYYKEGKNRSKNIEVTPTDIEKIFHNIPDDQIKLLGFNPSKTHPKHLIFRSIPVLPVQARPYNYSDGLKCEDDLTSIYNNIVNHNQKLNSEDGAYSYIKLVRNIQALLDNTKGIIKQPNGRANKGIKERIVGKFGLFRGNLQGDEESRKFLNLL